jgi:hypothetical protein
MCFMHEQATTERQRQWARGETESTGNCGNSQSQFACGAHLNASRQRVAVTRKRQDQWSQGRNSSLIKRLVDTGKE